MPSQVEVAILIGDGDAKDMGELRDRLKVELPSLRASTLDIMIPPNEVLATGAAQEARAALNKPESWENGGSGYTPYMRFKHDEL